MHRTLLTLDQAAARIHRSPDTLRYWRKRNEGPRSFRLGRRIVYSLDDLERWIDEQRAAEPWDTPAGSSR